MTGVNALVDAGILLDLLRDHPPAVRWKMMLGRVALGITPLVWMDVFAAAPDMTAQRQAVDFMRQFGMIYPLQEDMEWAMRQFAALHAAHGVNPRDCLVAAPCVRLRLRFYTHDLENFVPLLGNLVQQPY